MKKEKAPHAEYHIRLILWRLADIHPTPVSAHYVPLNYLDMHFECETAVYDYVLSVNLMEHTAPCQGRSVFSMHISMHEHSRMPIAG